MEQGKHILADAELREKEVEWGEERAAQTIRRTQKENKFARQAERRKLDQDRYSKCVLHSPLM